MNLIYADKSYQILKGLYAVQNEIGLGRGEEHYHQAFRMWLEQGNIPYFSKKPHLLRVGMEIAQTLYPDFVLWDCMTLELKALPRRLRDSDRVQIHNYLKCRGDRLGLLVNMGLDRVHVERYVHGVAESASQENWHEWPAFPEAQQIREALRQVHDEHQTGYGTEITRNLLAAAMGARGISQVADPIATSHYQGSELGKSRLDCWILSGKVVFCHTALFEDNEFNIARTRSFMEALDLPFGLAANFGKQTLHIKALAR